MNETQSTAITTALQDAGFANLTAEVDDAGLCALSGFCRDSDGLSRAAEVVANFEPTGLDAESVDFQPSVADATMAILLQGAVNAYGYTDVLVEFEDGVVILTGDIPNAEAEEVILGVVDNFGVEEVEIGLMYPEMAEFGDEEIEDTDDPTTYTVQKGDSWWRIAKNTLGSGSKWKRLKKHNGSPKVIHPGQVLNIPQLDVA